MSHYLLSVICCLCLLHTGVCAEDCDYAVLATRRTVIFPVGGRRTLSCEVQHCGNSWTGDWMWGNSTVANNVVKESQRHRLSNSSLSANLTRLTLDFLNVSKSDEGSYGCLLRWGKGQTAQGHLTYVNVTAALPSQRSGLHRVLVCGAAVLCLPLSLVLARCLSSRQTRPQPLPSTTFLYAAVSRDQPDSAPQPLPRSPIPQKEAPVPMKRSKVPPKSQQKTEVVYADISQDALKRQECNREPAPSTVYSSLKF